GTRRMATMMGEVAPEAHFVLCSSLAAAGPPRPGRPAREGDRDAPQSAYGRSKLFSEQVLAASGVRHTIVRPPAVYGPRDRDILAAFRGGARGSAGRMGPPRRRLSLVHAQDLAEGIALAGEREAGGTYYMSDGVVHLWEEVVAGIGAAVGRVPRIVPLPNPILNLAARLDRTRARLLGRNPLLTPDRARELAGDDWSCDDSRARRELGYVSRIGLEEGLRDTADWYRAQGWM